MTDDRRDAPETGPEESVRYRCALCGNLTRFDVTERRRTRSFYHFTIGGLLRIEGEDVLDREVEEVSCRWCSSPEHVEEVVGGPERSEEQPAETEGQRLR